MNTSKNTARAALSARNARVAEARFGRYSTRYVTGMWSKPATGCCSEPINGLPFNDLIDAAAYVAAVRASGSYASVSLYDRVAARFVTRGDVRAARAACGMAAEVSATA